MNIRQEFEDYCEGCPHIDIESEKMWAKTVSGEEEVFTVIRCSHADLCRRLWKEWASGSGNKER